MSNRGRGGGTRTIAKREGCKRKKRQCELGTSCPYQHEYQHKLEYSHDLCKDSSAKAPKCGDGRKPKSTLSQHTAGAIKGTGSRGRLVAVASDRRRAERVAAQHGDQVPGDDPRASQRARWVTKMQEQLQQPRSAAENSGAVHARDGRCEERMQVSALEQVSSSSSGVGLSRDRQEKRPRRQVEYIEILSDKEGEELSNTSNGGSSAASAVILQKPPLCNRSDAASEGCMQREGRRGRGVGEDDRGWHCKSCTFRNSSRMDLLCAVCGIERVF